MKINSYQILFCKIASSHSDSTVLGHLPLILLHQTDHTFSSSHHLSVPHRLYLFLQISHELLGHPEMKSQMTLKYYIYLCYVTDCNYMVLYVATRMSTSLGIPCHIFMNKIVNLSLYTSFSSFDLKLCLTGLYRFRVLTLTMVNIQANNKTHSSY